MSVSSRPQSNQGSLAPPNLISPKVANSGGIHGEFKIRITDTVNLAQS